MGDLGGEGGEDVQGMLESMMSQLMSKELLYEPMKELNEKVRTLCHGRSTIRLTQLLLQYPEYLASNSSKLPAADVERYKKQHALIIKIMKEFDDPSYTDDNPEKSALILKLMNEVSANAMTRINTYTITRRCKPLDPPQPRSWATYLKDS